VLSARSYRCLGCALLLIAASARAGAQGAQATSAAAAQQGDLKNQQYEQQQRQLQSKKNPTQPQIAAPGAAAAPAPGAGGASFALDHFEVSSSSVLSASQIQRALAPYEHRRVHFADLERAVAALNALYQQEGMITARAVLPRQQVAGGVVRIELIEARLDQVRIIGARSTAPDFFRARIHAQPGALLRLPQLQRDLILINSGNDVQARAVLEPGRSFGTTNLVVTVQEPENVSLTPSYDNIGRDNIGLRRLGLTLRDDSTFGERDAFTANASWATGTVSTSGAYSLPLDAEGLRMSLSADYAGIRILNGQLKTLGVRGHSTDFSLGLTQPMVVRSGFVLNETSAFDVMQSITTSNGFGISNQTVFAGELGANLQWFDAQGVWIASDGIALGNANLPAGRSFGRESAALTREENFGGDFSGILRFSGQTRLFAARTGLPLVEQLQLGGLSTVRGYPEGWQIADTGYALTNEFDYPLPLRQYFFGGAFSRGLKGALFADHGGVFGAAGPQRRLYLTSIGTGVIFNSPWLSGRLDWARPLENREGLPKVGFDFYLQPRVGLGWLGHRE